MTVTMPPKSKLAKLFAKAKKASIQNSKKYAGGNGRTNNPRRTSPNMSVKKPPLSLEVAVAQMKAKVNKLKEEKNAKKIVFLKSPPKPPKNIKKKTSPKKTVKKPKVTPPKAKMKITVTVDNKKKTIMANEKNYKKKMNAVVQELKKKQAMAVLKRVIKRPLPRK